MTRLPPKLSANCLEPQGQHQFHIQQVTTIR